MAGVFFSSVRVRLISLIMLAVVPALGLVFYSGLEDRRKNAAIAREDTHRWARLYADRELQAIESAQQILFGLSNMPVVREGNPAACAGLFAHLLGSYPSFRNLGAAAASGNIFASAAPLKSAANVSDLSWFQAAVQTRDFAVGNHEASRITDTPGINVGYPVLDLNRKVMIVLFAAIDLDRISQSVLQSELPQNSVLSVIDGNGTVLARSVEQEKWVGKSLPEVSILKTIMTQQEGTVEETGLDGIRRVYAFARLPGAANGPLAFVSIGIPAKVVYAGANRSMVGSLLWLGLVTGLFLAAAWVGSEALVLREINALVAATKRLSTGDLSARTGVEHGRGDIGQLARAFDEMAANLQAREAEASRAEEVRRLYEELEQRVVERTIELEAANKELKAQILERKRAETMLQARNDDLKGFAYTISHDLKAPLRGMAGYAEELDRRHRGGLSERALFCIGQVLTATRNLDRLIEDLLHYSHLDAETTNVTEVRVTELIGAILRDRASIITERCAEVSVNVPFETLPAWERGLSQALTNLIDNALKYSRNTHPPRIGITGEEVAQGYRLSVTDNGIGFDMKHHDRIFGLFNRLVRQEEFEGTGAGLAIAKKVIEKQGGKIWAESQVGGGATFYIELPGR